MCCFWNQFGRTEMILNCLNPKFSKKFVLDYYFEMVQRLKFCVYDIDNDSHTLADDDFLGELECTLGQVGFFSPRAGATVIYSPLTFLPLSLLSSCNHPHCAQIVSSRQMTRSLLLKDQRPAGHGTITVSTFKLGLRSGPQWDSNHNQCCNCNVLLIFDIFQTLCILNPLQWIYSKFWVSLMRASVYQTAVNPFGRFSSWCEEGFQSFQQKQHKSIGFLVPRLFSLEMCCV